MIWLVVTILPKVLSWLGGDVLSKFLASMENRVNNETERLRIRALRDQHIAATQASVITAGMQHKAFWIPWLMATVPLSLWFGWGMLGTAFPGYLPYVATIPPGLEPWAKAAWDSLFFSGAGVAGASMIAGAIKR
jgi:hypothetical protein